MNYVKVNCANPICNEEVISTLRDYNIRIKRKSDTKFFCSLICRYPAEIKLACFQCGTEIFRSPRNIEEQTNHFCSQTCSAIFNNKFRIENGYSLKGKKKQITCKICFLPAEVALNSVAHCKECSLKNKKNSREKFSKPVPKKCLGCEMEILLSKYAKYCDDCRRKVFSLNGQRLVQFNNNRSKNEIHFANLCKTKFDNVLENVVMFDGWDADVILPDLKVAALWNGNWHYIQIAKNRSLKQIQNRDRIKLKKIKEAGYISYIIEDRGKENKKFVQEQFDIFVAWTETNETNRHRQD